MEWLQISQILHTLLQMAEEILSSTCLLPLNNLLCCMKNTVRFFPGVTPLAETQSQEEEFTQYSYRILHSCIHSQNWVLLSFHYLHSSVSTVTLGAFEELDELYTIPKILMPVLELFLNYQ